MSRDDQARMLVKRLASTIADEFAASDLVYTCGAVPMEFARKRIIPLTDVEPYREFRTHRFFEFRRIQKAVWDEVHNRWKESRK